MSRFGDWLNCQEFSEISDEMSPTEQVHQLFNMISKQVEHIFFLKSVKFSNTDKPFITSEIKRLDRKKKRIYRKQGKSIEYLKISQLFKEKYKKASSSFIQKNVSDLKCSNPSKAYSVLKRLGARPGDCSQSDNSFTLLNHLEADLSAEQQVEKISEHFSSISQEFTPINIEDLPLDLQYQLGNTSEHDIPQITVNDVYSKLLKTKKPKSNVPGDLPKQLIKQFSRQLANPIKKIFSNILKTFTWPDQWKIEFGTPVPKVQVPKDEDDKRIISLTAFLSKVMEQFVIDWLLHFIGDKIDWGQYGGLKGTSISHYLIELINFVLYNQDLRNPHAVLTIMADFQKAFNRQSHSDLVSKMQVPGWLLKIIIAFLKDQVLIVRHKGKQSEKKKLPGGSPAGTRLGMLLLLILINLAGFTQEELEKNLGEKITKSLKSRKSMEKIHLKYIDDFTFGASLDLKKDLIIDPDHNPVRPLSYRNRTGHIMRPGESVMQTQLNGLIEYADQHKMKINYKKTKCMLFNPRRKLDFMPHLITPSGDSMELVENMRLLGVEIRSDLRWINNTDTICKKFYERLWIIRNLRKLGTKQAELVDVYAKQVRVMVELAVPVWEPGLTISESQQIERCQKVAFAAILGWAKNDISYRKSLKILGLKSLKSRHSEICEKFARKSVNNPKFRTWYSINEVESKAYNTRSKQPFLKPVTTRTVKFKRSPLPFLTSLLNNTIQGYDDHKSEFHFF